MNRRDIPLRRAMAESKLCQSIRRFSRSRVGLTRSALPFFAGFVVEAVVLFIGLSGCFNVLAAASLTPYVVSGWEIKGSLPLNEIRVVVQSRDGFLWLAVSGGLVRFDGYSLKLFNKVNTSVLPGNPIDCLFEDHTGRLWIGSNTGEIVFMEHGQFKRVGMSSTWPIASIANIVEGGDGTIWVINRLGNLISIKDGKPRQILPGFDKRSGKTDSIKLLTDAGGTVWVVEGSSLFAVTGKGASKNAVKIPTTSLDPVIFAARAGGFWVVDGTRLRRWEQGTWVEDRGQHDWGDILGVMPFETTNGTRGSEHLGARTLDPAPGRGRACGVRKPTHMVELRQPAERA